MYIHHYKTRNDLQCLLATFKRSSGECTKLGEGNTQQASSSGTNILYPLCKSPLGRINCLARKFLHNWKTNFQL